MKHVHFLFFQITIHGIAKLLCVKDLEVPMLSVSVDIDPTSTGVESGTTLPHKKRNSVLNNTYVTAEKLRADNRLGLTPETTTLLHKHMTNGSDKHHDQDDHSITMKRVGSGVMMEDVNTLDDIRCQMVEVKSALLRLENSSGEKMLRQRMSLMTNKEWRNVGVVLDRFFFVIYLFLNGISLAVLFPKPT